MLGAKLKAKGIDGFNYFASTDQTLNISFYPLLWQAGGDVFSKDGKSAAFNQQPGVDALTFLASFAPEVPPADGDTVEA